MPNLQYIGARYVPIVYDNPDDHSSDWKSGVSYENLVIVTYLDDSYTSRKPVPASVGNPADNPDYWAKTGDFNAGLTALEGRVDTLENVTIPNVNDRIDKLPTKRRFVLLGDSFGYGVVGGGNPRGTGWLDGFANNQPAGTAIYLSDVEIQALVGVAGFCGTLPFIDILNEIYNTKFPNGDQDTITDIVVLGGSNDLSAGSSAIDTAIYDFMTYANAHFPNARVHIGVLMRKIHDGLLNGVVSGYAACRKYNADYIADTFALCILPEYYSTDGTHLTATGYDFYQRFINQAIVSGKCDYNFEFTVNATLDSSVINNPPSLVCRINHNNHNTKIAFSHNNVGWPIEFLAVPSNQDAFSDFITLDTAVEFPFRYKDGGGFSILLERTVDGSNVVNPAQDCMYYVADTTHFGVNVGASATSGTGVNRALAQIGPTNAKAVDYSPF